MDMKQELASLRKRIAELEAQVAAQPAADSWPKTGDSYWTIQASGAVLTYRYLEDKFDLVLIEIGNIFRTEEEALREVERRKVLTQMRKLAKAAWGEVKCSWKPGTDKWYVQYAHGSCEWLVIYACSIEIQGVVYFPSEKSAYDAIRTIGADHMMLLLED